jgi:hypothetical protein
MGIAEVITAPRSPWQNAYGERVIGSIRRDCLDHLVIFNERQLRRARSSYVDYYQSTRTHLSLDKHSPDSRPVMRPQNRKDRRHPESRRVASLLRTSRRLIRPELLLTNGCVQPERRRLRISGCSILNPKSFAFWFSSQPISTISLQFHINPFSGSNSRSDGILSRDSPVAILFRISNSNRIHEYTTTFRGLRDAVSRR